MSLSSLEQIVINLHFAAKTVESELGQCKLSIDIRQCANMLSNHLNPSIPNNTNTEGTQ